MKICSNLLLVIFVLFGNFLYSQECQTVGSNPVALRNFSNTPQPKGQTSLPSNVKVYFHFYYKADASNEDDYYNRQYQIIDSLNTSFAGQFTFFFVGCETSVYYDDFLNGSAASCDFFIVNQHLDGLDIHIKADFNSSSTNVAKNVPSDEVLIGRTHTDGTPRVLSSTLAHEVGHAFGLYHTFEGGSCGTSSGFILCDGSTSVGASSDLVNDTPYDDHGYSAGNNVNCTWNQSSGTCGGQTSNPLIDNFMSYFHHQCRSSFTPDQYTRMKSLVLPEILYNAKEEQCCGYGEDEMIYWDQEYDETRDILGNLIVTSGATLTITGNYTFGKNKYILVERGAKLIIDNGFLTKCVESEDWRGIYVEGNSSLPQPNPSSIGSANEAGIVIVKNNSKIEFARTAISTNDVNESSGYWGGVIYAENSEFRNNRRSIEFMRYNFPNKSRFINNTFNGNSSIVGTTYGITIWGCSNIQFTGNVIEEMEGTGIQVVDGSIKVTSQNKFDDNRRGISCMSTFPFSSSLLVQNNEFKDTWFDISIQSSDMISGTSIVNNKFQDALNAIKINGTSQFSITNNSFNSVVRDISIINTGAQNNSNYSSIKGNAFGANTGVEVKGNNSSVELTCNSFNTSRDIHLKNYSSTTSIRPYQGSAFSPADNCFSSNQSSIDILTDSNTDGFTYYYGNTPCYFPTNPGNYVANFSVQMGCFESPPAGPSKNYLGELNGYKKTISAFEEVDNHGREYYTAIQERDVLLDAALTEADANGDFEAIDELLSTLDDKNSLFNRFGNALNHNAFDLARTLLREIERSFADQTSFVEFQKINLRRLEHGVDFRLSDDEFNFVTSLSQSSESLSAYANSLLFILYGVMPSEEFEEMNLSLNAMADPELKIETKNYKIFPVPSNDYFRIESSQDDILKVEIVDVSGSTVMSFPHSRNKFYRHDLRNGLYFIKCFSIENELVYQQKLIVSSPN